jgi:hypothetical protein
MALDAEESLPATSLYRFSPDQRIQAAVHFLGAVNEVQRPPLHPDECLVYCIHLTFWRNFNQRTPAVGMSRDLTC